MEEVKGVSQQRKALFSAWFGKRGIRPPLTCEEVFSAGMDAALAELQKDAKPVAWSYEVPVWMGLDTYVDRPRVSIEKPAEHQNRKNIRPLYAHPQPKAATVPEGFAALYEECFQHVFAIYNTPRDKFNTDEQWALFCYRQVYDNLGKFQKLRAMLSAAPSIPTQSSKTPDAYSFEIDGQPGVFFGSTVPPFGKNARALDYREPSQSKGERK